MVLLLWNIRPDSLLEGSDPDWTMISWLNVWRGKKTKTKLEMSTSQAEVKKLNFQE